MKTSSPRGVQFILRPVALCLSVSLISYRRMLISFSRRPCFVCLFPKEKKNYGTLGVFFFFVYFHMLTIAFPWMGKTLVSTGQDVSSGSSVCSKTVSGVHWQRDDDRTADDDGSFSCQYNYPTVVASL